MILADTSVWIDHLRVGDEHLSGLLRGSQFLAHPAVIGELALGRLTRRQEVLSLLANLPSATQGTDVEVLTLVEEAGPHGRGIGHVDANLLASTLLTPGARLWTRDRRLGEAAARLSVAWSPPS